MADEPVPGGELAGKLAKAMAAHKAAGPVFDPPPPPEPVDRLDVRRAEWAEAIPPRFADARLDTLPLSSSMTELRAWCESDDTTNLVLTGPVGSGKTWAAAAAARCRFGRGQSVAWWPVPRLLRELRPGGDQDVIDDVETVDVLVLDDLAAHRSTEWTDEQLLGLVDHRWAHLLPVIATTNASVTNLEGAMDERLWSRLFSGVVLTMKGHDRRQT